MPAIPRNATPAAKLAVVKQAIREPYAWPGGYPLYLVMSDGELLSLDAARKEWATICYAVFSGDEHGGWMPAGVDINWENPDLYCAHTNARIPSAYAEDDAPAG